MKMPGWLRLWLALSLLWLLLALFVSVTIQSPGDLTLPKLLLVAIVPPLLVLCMLRLSRWVLLGFEPRASHNQLLASSTILSLSALLLAGGATVHEVLYFVGHADRPGSSPVIAISAAAICLLAINQLLRDLTDGSERAKPAPPRQEKDRA